MTTPQNALRINPTNGTQQSAAADLVIAPPPPPGREAWHFLDELQQRQPLTIAVNCHCDATSNEAVDLSNGVRLAGGFPDPKGLLKTAQASLLHLLQNTSMLDEAGVPIQTQHVDGLAPESFQIEQLRDRITISSSDIEGIRRGMYLLEQRFLGVDGPTLQIGKTEITPWIKNRISRCLFGPIKRPPLNHDELLDDIDYYPDAYLDRLAREGVNGLWLTLAFRDLCETAITDLPSDGKRRLAKLRRTIDKCAQYGIKTWAFCIEPRGFQPDDPLLAKHPELGGADIGSEICFCPSSDITRQYLYESTQWLFSNAPGLGGLINITHGERTTTCLSSVACIDESDVKCDRCGTIPKWRILHQSLSAMRDGMRDVDANAELISWLYMPQPRARASWVYDLAAHVPEGVIVQYNFESNLSVSQLGKVRIGGDYWQSHIGPCNDFKQIATSANNAGTQTSAKIQVGCSHEVATVPFVPVPGLLYRKYQQMRQLGCEHVMQCWYFGNYPGMMNRAAGALALEPWQESEESFLLRQARIDWQDDAPIVVRAWQAFADAYSHFPLENAFQYYGPMHDGPVWPLHLVPIMKPLAPTWHNHFPPSGDAIGECLGSFSLDEAIELCTRLADGWQCGLQLLEPLKNKHANKPQCAADLGVAEALGVQFASGCNILQFYKLRSALLSQQLDEARQTVDAMKQLVTQEISNSEKLIALCNADSRLGFHSEAESHKYFPAKLQWRIDQLQQLLATDFQTLTSLMNAGKTFSAMLPDRPAVRCNEGSTQTDTFRWRAVSDRTGITIHVEGDTQDIHRTVFYACLTNQFVTHQPWIMRCDEDEPNIQDEHIRCTFTRASDSQWTAKAHLSIDAWKHDPARKPAHILVYSHQITTQRSVRIAHWPHCEVEKPRLNLGYFAPQHMADLIID